MGGVGGYRDTDTEIEIEIEMFKTCRYLQLCRGRNIAIHGLYRYS
jgi:hypothetical protein